MSGLCDNSIVPVKTQTSDSFASPSLECWPVVLLFVTECLKGDWHDSFIFKPESRKIRDGCRKRWLSTD